MLVYFHILSEEERILDPDGHDCADLAEARREATQSARELIANELRSGRPVPLKWRIDVADTEGGVLTSVNFAELVLGEAAHPHLSSRPGTTKEIIEHAYAIVAQAQERGAAVREALGVAHAGLRTLAQLNVTLAKKIR